MPEALGLLSREEMEISLLNTGTSSMDVIVDQVQKPLRPASTFVEAGPTQKVGSRNPGGLYPEILHAVASRNRT